MVIQKLFDMGDFRGISLRKQEIPVSYIFLDFPCVLENISFLILIHGIVSRIIYHLLGEPVYNEAIPHSLYGYLRVYESFQNHFLR